MSNKISIITASFRSESTIKDTLESVNIQTYPLIDHIIIDGASKDGTLDLVKNLGKRDGRRSESSRPRAPVRAGAIARAIPKDPAQSPGYVQKLHG